MKNTKQAEDNLPTIALVGRVNVGKSTLFNRMIEERKAIVSVIPGTTRTSNEGTILWRGKQIKIVDTAWATIGSVSNEEHGLVKLGKAGRSRKMGRRPTVRGSAMGSHDHPHGGGEGRAGRGHRRARSKWGKPTGKGQKTRAPKKYSNQFIVSRRKVGKRK